jgi:hypothetical protein
MHKPSRLKFCFPGENASERLAVLRDPETRFINNLLTNHVHNVAANSFRRQIDSPGAPLPTHLAMLVAAYQEKVSSEKHRGQDHSVVRRCCHLVPSSCW